MHKAEWFALGLVLALALRGALLPPDSQESSTELAVEAGLAMPGWPHGRVPSEPLCRSAIADAPAAQAWRAGVHETVELLAGAAEACTQRAPAGQAAQLALAGLRLSMAHPATTLAR